MSNKTNRKFSAAAGLAALLLLQTSVAVRADFITYDTWTTNENDSGNYILTVDDNDAGVFNVNLTVNPWNAEALGLFMDFGDFDLPGGVGLSNVNPAGEVALFATDTSSDGCGMGCNLNGLAPPIATPDGEWELVFRLGGQGFDGIQTFSFQINDFGLSLDDWGLIGIRAQNYCSGDDVLPNGSCDGSDKSFGSTPGGGMEVAEPGTLALLGLGLFGICIARRRII